jgi:hypothetical protein
MLFDYTLGQTSIILRVVCQQDTTGSNPGYGFTGLSNTTSGLNISTIADNEASATSYTSAGSTIQTIATLGTYAAPSASDCRFAKVDDTNLPGLVEIQLANARFAVSNAKSLIVFITGVTGMMQCRVVIPLRSVNPYDGVHGGMSALPNTACTTNASLLTSGTGTDQLSVASGLVNVGKINGVSTSSVTTVSTYIGSTQALTFDGNNYLKVDLVDIAGSALSTSSAQIGVNLVNIAGSAVSATSAQLGVNVVNYNGQTAVTDGNNYPSVNIVDIAGSAVATGSAQLGVNVVNWNAHAVSVDSNNSPNVSAKYWAGTAITATSLPVATAAGASGGVFIAGTNDHCTITNNLLVSGNATVSGTTTLTGAVTASNSGNNIQVNAVQFSGQTITCSAGVTIYAAVGAAHEITVDASGNANASVIKWNGTAVNGSIPPDVPFIRTGTAQAGGNSTITLDSGASSTNNFYQNQIVVILSGTGSGQSALIASYVGSTKVATINGTWATNPDSTSVFALQAFGSISATVSGTISANVVQWGSHNIATPNVNGVPVVDIGYALGTISAGAAGYVGIDWSAINDPTATVGLTGTTISGISTAGAKNVADQILIRDWTATATAVGQPARYSLWNAGRVMCGHLDTTTNAGYITVFTETGTQAFTQAIVVSGTAELITSAD